VREQAYLYLLPVDKTPLLDLIMSGSDPAQYRDAVIHDTIENELLEVTEVTTNAVITEPLDEEGSNEKRIPMMGVQGLKGSRYVVKDDIDR
jgi:hypothetical protein